MARTFLKDNRLIFSLLIIYIFLIFYSNLVPNEPNLLFHMVSLLLSISHYVLLLSIKKHFQSSYVVVTDWAWLILSLLTCLVFSISVLGNTRTIFYDNLYYILPLLFTHCIFYLTVGRKIHLDEMMDLKNKLASFTDNGFLYRMKSMSKTVNDGFNNTSIERVTKIINFNDKTFENPLINEYYFGDVRFLFVNDKFSNSRVLLPPSSNLYSKFSGSPVIENPFGLERLRENTLTGLYINFLDYSLSQNSSEEQNWIGNNQFLLNNNYKLKSEVNTASGRLELTIRHNWDLSEIKQVSGIIVDALKTQSSPQHERLTEEILLIIDKNKLCMGIHLDLFLASLILNSIIEIDKYSNYEYYWRGVVDCFDKSKITLSSINSSKSNYGDSIDSVYLKNRVSQIEKGILEIKNASTEEFIRYHDIIAKNESNLDYARETQLTQIVKQMMSEFSRTQYLEKLTLDGRYDISDLVKTRRGILTASAIILRLTYENIHEVRI